VANTFFQFKKFIVHQEHTAMKVCTDACLFGGWLAKDESLSDANSILDIGTGTGLLSLMIAQANQKAIIKAIEIDPNAAKQASANFSLCPWQNRLELIASSLQNFVVTTPAETFDCVISNPPFYEGDLLSPDTKRNLALHSIALPWETLINNSTSLLKQGGFLYVLVPSIRAYTFQKMASLNGLALQTEITIYNSSKAGPFRSIMKFMKGTPSMNQIYRNSIKIKNEDNNYSAEFVSLLNQYYLHF
jgi:tRNA1Val (adenine37-N6)-methyltransferase